MVYSRLHPWHRPPNPNPKKRGRKPRQLVDGKLLCCRCKLWLPEDGFALDKTASTGRRSECRSCWAIRNKSEL